MSISITEAVQNIFSDRYNKTNVLYYCILAAITSVVSIIYLIQVYGNSGNELSVLSAMACFQLISLVIMIFIMGIHIYAVNRGYNGQDSIFPNFFDDFKTIILTGLQFYGGFIIIYIACVFIFFIIGLFLFPMLIFTGYKLSEMNMVVVTGLTILILFSIVLMLFLIITMCGLIFNFTKSLRFEDFLNVKKALHLINTAKKEFLIYFLKYILVIILAGTLFFGIFLVISLGISFQKESSIIQLAMVFIILYTLYVIIIGLLSIDLQIQFLTETKKYEIDEPKEDDDFQEEDFQEDEYLEDYYDYPENEE